MPIYLQKEFENILNDSIKSAINTAVSIAKSHNTKIYLIGGIVRDLIMNNPIKDIDITVESDAIDFCRFLQEEAEFKITAVQENLRTAKVQYKNGIEIDFTSTREEKYEIEGNLPAAYNFGCDLENDVKRRDFTINTIALDLNDYKLIDYYNGYNDISNKQIKILHPKSFSDDPSRIIRALKFMVRFNFSIEDETKDLMQKYLENVNMKMPLERIKSELKQYFSIDTKETYEIIINSNAYKLVSDSVVLNFNQDYFDEIISYKLFDSAYNWFVYLLLIIFKSDFALARLNLTSYEQKSVTDLKELYYNRIKDDNYSIYKEYNGKTDTALSAYYVITGNKSVIKYLEKLKNIKAEINGNDLIALGMSPSPKFNEILENILKEKLDGKLQTKQEEIEYVKANWM